MVKEELQSTFEGLKKLEDFVTQILEQHRDCLESIKNEIKENLYENLTLGEILFITGQISHIISSYISNLLMEEYFILEVQEEKVELH